MRTQDEIVSRIDRIRSEDFFGFETSDLVVALDYEHAKPFLASGCTKEEWDLGRPEYTPENSRKLIRDYLEFAWEKANDERGISASRSQSHFRAWIWLAGDDEVLAAVESAPYEPYGKPKLEVVEAHYGRSSTQPQHTTPL